MWVPLAKAQSPSPSSQVRAPVPGELVITEVVPNPSSENEWFEITNTSSDTLSLADILIWDELSQPSIIHTFEATDIIRGDEIIVVTLSKSVLNNSGDGIQIKTEADAVLAQLQYTESPETGLSWHRLTTSPTLFEDLPNPGFSANPPPSPQPSASPETTPQPTASTAHFDSNVIMLSEIMACPSDGKKEWIELHNTSKDFITITDWKVFDSSLNSQTIALQIPAGNYRIVEFTSNILNNAGDSIQLLDTSNQVIDSAILESCQANTSFSRDGNMWVQTIPSPNQANVISKTDEASEKATASAKTNSNTDETKTEIISVPNTPIDIQQPLPKLQASDQALFAQKPRKITTPAISIDPAVVHILFVSSAITLATSAGLLSRKYRHQLQAFWQLAQDFVW